MQKKSCLFRYIAIVFLAFISIMSETEAQEPTVKPRQNEAIKLTGSRFKAEELIAAHATIFVGKITKMEPPIQSNDFSGAYAGPSFNGVKVTVLSVLNGVISEHTSVSLFVAKVIGETTPVVDAKYVFFVKKADGQSGNEFSVVKLLPATDANITEVKTLIAALPASK